MNVLAYGWSRSQGYINKKTAPAVFFVFALARLVITLIEALSLFGWEVCHQARGVLILTLLYGLI